MAPGVMSLSSPWRGQGPQALGAWGPWGPGGWLWVDAADLRKHIRVYKLGERGPSIAAAAARRINTPTNYKHNGTVCTSPGDRPADHRCQQGAGFLSCLNADGLHVLLNIHA